MNTTTEKLNQIEKEVTAAISKQNSRADEIARQITAAQERHSKAIADASSAFAAASAKDYHAAQDEARTAIDTKEMYKRQAEEIKTKPVFTDAQYQNYLAEIMKTLAEDVADSKAKVIDLLDQIIAVCEDNGKNIEQGNKLLHSLQFDGMKEDCCVITGAGSKVFMNHLQKKFSDYVVPQFGEMMKNEYFYKEGKR